MDLTLLTVEELDELCGMMSTWLSRRDVAEASGSNKDSDSIRKMISQVEFSLVYLAQRQLEAALEEWKLTHHTLEQSRLKYLKVSGQIIF